MVFKLAFIGYLSPIKGSDQLYDIMMELEFDNVEFYLFGMIYTNKIKFPFKECKSYTGIDELKNLIDLYEIDCAILLSICDETYSYVLSECWKCGIPVIGTKFGAIGERITRHDGGWIIDPYDINDVIILIRKLIDNPDLVKLYKDKVNKIKLKSLKSMIDDYYKLYEAVKCLD